MNADMNLQESQIRRRRFRRAQNLLLLGILLIVGVNFGLEGQSHCHELDNSPIQSMPPSQRYDEKHQNKTLVIVMGDLRCGEPCWKSLQENVIQPNQADLALLIQEPKPQYENASLLEIAKYHWHVPQFENWLDALDIIMGNSSDWHTNFFQTLSPIYQQNIVLGPIRYQFPHQSTAHQFPGSAVIIFMMRFFLSQHIERLRLHLDGGYDWFIVTRSDHYYRCEHKLTNKLQPEYVYIPRGEDYGGISDRHMIVHRQHVLASLNILPPLLQHPDQYKGFFQAREHHNSEMFVKLRFRQQGLRSQRFPRTMFLAGVAGVDSANWKSAWKTVQSLDKDILFKYQNEYYASKRACHKILGRKRRRRNNQTNAW